MLSEFLNSINQTKKNLIAENSRNEKEYLPFVVNKCFSYFPDTIFHANRMNHMPFLDKKMQYDYLLHSVSKRKRFSKWVKPEENSNIEHIKEVFGYSTKRAMEVETLLPMDKIKEMTNKGGQKR
jgi:hypothetical protein